MDVLVLPREIREGEALYHDTVLTLVKELRVEGATAAYQHGPDSRDWIGEKHLSPAEIEFFVAISAHAGWDAVRSLLRRRHRTGRVRARVARVTQKDGEIRSEIFEVDGPGDEVARALELLERGEDAESTADEVDGGSSTSLVSDKPESDEAETR